MKIAICDDSAEIRNRLNKLIKAQYPQCEISGFSDGKQLLTSPYSFDLIFLDIAMGELSGIEAAKLLRKRDNAATRPLIVFITAYREYMEQAFDVNAFHYLVKPISEEKFKYVFAAALKEIKGKAADKFIMIKANGEREKILLKDIFYVESSNKKSVFHTTSGTVEVYYKIEDLEKELEGQFFRCHRCYLVNLESVTGYGYEGIKLMSGENLPMSKKKYPLFVKAYMRYAEEGGAVNV